MVNIIRTSTKVLSYFLLALVCAVIIFLVNGYIEKAFIRNEIKEFVSRGKYETTLVENTLDGTIYVDYYKVKAKHTYEDLSRRIFNINDRNKYVGAKADIILTTRNPLRGLNEPLIEKPVEYLATNFFIGHASINITDDGSRIVEVVGNQEDNGVREWSNDWLVFDDASPEIVALRIKNTTNENRNQMVDYCTKQIGKKYNYMFLINMPNSYYCTDLISRASKYAGININYDFFQTTGNDMIMSNNTYIIFYRVKTDTNRYKAYYLSEE